MGRHTRSYEPSFIGGSLKPFNPKGDLRSPTDDLRRSAVRGAGATVFSAAVSLALQIVATAVLARLLTPADFGVVTMVTAFSLLLMNFGLNGFTETDALPTRRK